MITGLKEFLTESNAIEDLGPPNDGDIKVANHFLKRVIITVDDLSIFVSTLTGVPELRSRKGMNMRVGNHLAPLGGLDITRALKYILTVVNNNERHPYTIHHEYESLHPFSDGNGRSGRLLWAWQMRKNYSWNITNGFLKTFYFQSLEED